MTVTGLSEKNWKFVEEAFRLASGSLPSDDTLRWAIQLLDHGCDPRDFLIALAANGGGFPGVASRGSPLFVDPGHFYSPIVDPAALVVSDLSNQKSDYDPLAVEIDDDQMGRFFNNLRPLIESTHFPEAKEPGHRYFYNNDFFGAGDAIILSCMIRHFRPRRIVEVGSGFSSAVILDTIGLRGYSSETRCTFIEPNLDRLRALLWDADKASIQIIESEVQMVDLTLFEELRSNDILFLDTTHVSKTGSDVNFEVFEVLPRLKSGVVVHFHDIFNNFEYPLPWVVNQNRSWNELYLLRAFLMYNTRFEVLFFNHHFVSRNLEAVRLCSPWMAEQPGGSLWLRKR